MDVLGVSGFEFGGLGEFGLEVSDVGGDGTGRGNIEVVSLVLESSRVGVCVCICSSITELSNGGGRGGRYGSNSERVFL